MNYKCDILIEISYKNRKVLSLNSLNFCNSRNVRKKNDSEKLFMNFQFSGRILKDIFYRKLGESLDLNSIYKETRNLYGSTGNPSIDPVVFLRLPGKYHL